jgi:hypothetical protein
MKFQLTPTQVTIFASKAGSYTQMEESAKRVLSIFAQEGHDPYTRRDVIAVIQAMGGPSDPIYDILPETGEESWRTLNPVVKGNPRAPGRGYYTQGDRVGKRAPVTAETAVRDDGLQVVRKTGIVWTPPNIEADTESEGYYEADPGLRQMAVAESQCFGTYNANDSGCEECPLARWCSDASMATMADLAARLDRETEDAIVKAAEAMLRGQKPEETAQTKTQTKAAESAPEETPSETGSAAEFKGWPTGYNEVELPFQGICSECDGTIAKGETAVHKPGTGMLHQDCAKKGLPSS